MRVLHGFANLSSLGDLLIVVRRQIKIDILQPELEEDMEQDISYLKRHAR